MIRILCTIWVKTCVFVGDRTGRIEGKISILKDVASSKLIRNSKLVGYKWFIDLFADFGVDCKQQALAYRSYLRNGSLQSSNQQFLHLQRHSLLIIRRDIVLTFTVPLCTWGEGKLCSSLDCGHMVVS